MLSVAEAQQLVLAHAYRRGVASAALGPDVPGLVLAEDVLSDLDMPPYDKSLMDGYAVRSADLAEPETILRVVEEIHAGAPPQRPVGPGEAARIMTGAPLPSNADAVVILERTESLDGERVRVREQSPQPGQNILVQGREMRRGERVLPAGAVLRPQELGLLATVGRTAVQVYRRPIAAILPTGDEVVEPAVRPGPGQIRNSNAAMLAAQIARAGALPRYLGIARDHLGSLCPLVSEGLQADLLILSGGVSAGKRDLVPGVLQELGVEPVFHKVAMKPGKPLFFGTKGESLVFGLPGNPVSALVGFELFVRPALRRMLGYAEAGPRLLTARLAADHHHRSDRPTYHPSRLDVAGGGWQVTPVAWFGSADLRAITQANAFTLFPAGDRLHRQGEQVEVLAPEQSS